MAKAATVVFTEYRRCAWNGEPIGLDFLHRSQVFEALLTGRGDFLVIHGQQRRQVSGEAHGVTKQADDSWRQEPPEWYTRKLGGRRRYWKRAEDALASAEAAVIRDHARSMDAHVCQSRSAVRASRSGVSPGRGSPRRRAR